MNSAEYRVKILGLLENYQQDTATISLLNMALNRAPRVSAEEVIGSMNFAHGDGIGAATGHISDRTAFIAMHYLGKTDAINKEAVSDVATLLWKKTQERGRLDMCIARLSPRQRKVVTLYYMEDMSREDIAESFGVSVRTFHNILKGAIDRLVEMYEFTSAMDD